MSMKLPFGLTYRGLAENLVATVLFVIALALWDKFRPHGAPDVGEILPYVALFACGMIVVTILRRSTPPHTHPSSPVTITGRTGPPIPPREEPTEISAVAVRTESESSSSREAIAIVDPLQLPWEALDRALYEGIVNRGLGTSPFLMGIRLKPRLTASVRGAILEIKPTGGDAHEFLIMAYISRKKNAFGVYRDVLVPVAQPRTAALVEIGDILPDSDIILRLLVASSWITGFEPSFHWFIRDDQGVERAAGTMTVDDFLAAQRASRKARN
jgi:hypothetical protein